MALNQPTPLVLAAVTIVLALMPAAGFGNSEIRTAWIDRYGGSSFSMDNLSSSCTLCHAVSGGGNWNGYGWNLREQLEMGVPLDQAFTNIEGLDSDADPTGSSNLEEILASTQPGWTAGPNNTYYFANGQTIENQEPAPLDAGTYDPEVAQCPGDTNGDLVVDVSDLVNVVLDWGCIDPPGPCDSDVTGDGVVDVADLVAVVLAWGAC